MKLRELFQEVSLTKVKLNLKFAELEWEPKDSDREAAWELYVELLTRVVTQPLAKDHGWEKAALESIHSLFPTTRRVLRSKGRNCTEFTKVAIPVLNQVIRPFTAKWHKLSLASALQDTDQCQAFRADLADLQQDMASYTRLLATIAQVEDLSELLS